jgi:general secretion pathway protein G
MAFHTATGRPHSVLRGFTLIEMLVVMAIIATLLSIAAPRYFRSTDDAREAALKSDLRTVREAIDHYHADRGSYPETLDDLVEKRYLRAIPVDPITGDATSWTLIPPAAPTQGSAPVAPGSLPAAAPTGIYDIRSGASGTTRDGESYQNL